jgi:hypothetical protein
VLDEDKLRIEGRKKNRVTKNKAAVNKRFVRDNKLALSSVNIEGLKINGDRKKKNMTLSADADVSSAFSQMGLGEGSGSN